MDDAGLGETFPLSTHTPVLPTTIDTPLPTIDHDTHILKNAVEAISFEPLNWLNGWHSELTHLAILIERSHVPKAEIARILIDGLVAKISQHDEVIAKLFEGELPAWNQISTGTLRYSMRQESMYRNYIELLQGVARIAVNHDLGYVQAVMAHQIKYSPDQGVALSTNMIAALPELETKNAIYVAPDDTFSYFHYRVRIEPAPIKQVRYVREVLSGFALLAEDENNQPVGIVKIETLPEDMSINTLTATLYDTDEAFVEASYYGLPPSMTEIQACLDDSEFHHYLNEEIGMGGVNQNSLPLTGRVRFHQAYRTPELREKTKIALDVFSIDTLALAQYVSAEDTATLMRLYHYLAANNAELGMQFIKGIARVLEEATSFVSPRKHLDIIHLFEKKAQHLLLEVLKLYKSGQLRNFSIQDESIVLQSGLVLFGIASNARAFIQQGTKPDFPEVYGSETRPPMPVGAPLEFLDFIGRHPEAIEIFQTWFDFTTIIELIRESESDFAQNYAQSKADFYTEYTTMNEQSATTNTPTDIARTTSTVTGLKERNLAPQGSRILFAGSGNMQRLENIVLKNLAAAGIQFDDIVAVDLVDYSKELPHDFAVRFLQANLIENDLSTGGKFDYIFLPWSVISDVLKIKDLKSVLKKFSRLLTPGGILVLDMPLPIGQHSYAETLKQQRGQFPVGSIMERCFTAGDKEIRSFFNVMELETLVWHCLQAGFAPCNIPPGSAERAKIYAQIKDNDDFLARNHEQNLDLDAFSQPLWQGNGYNRTTLILKNVGSAGIEEQFGALPGLLDTMLAASDRESELKN